MNGYFYSNRQWLGGQSEPKEGACVSLVGGHQSRLVLKPDGRVQTDDRVQRTPMDREQNRVDLTLTGRRQSYREGCAYAREKAITRLRALDDELLRCKPSGWTVLGFRERTMVTRFGRRGWSVVVCTETPMAGQCSLWTSVWDGGLGNWRVRRSRSVWWRWRRRCRSGRCPIR